MYKMRWNPFFKNLFPETIAGKLLGAAALLPIGVGTFTFLYAIYHKRYEEPYKKSVCWPHYSGWYLEANKQVNHDRYEVKIREMEYKTCLKAAQKGKKIYPPSILESAS